MDNPLPESNRSLSLLDGIVVLLLLAVSSMVWFYTPLETVMGWVQKVFYFHVASLWVGMLGFLLAAGAGIVYLRTRRFFWDHLGEAAVEISLVFFFAGIVSGSIWARPVWNTWWTWDPRLTSAAIVELIYAAYFVLRQSLETPEKRARFCAAYAILGFVSVPVTFVSIRMLRTIHPVVIGGLSGIAQPALSMTPVMLQTLIFSILVFSLLFVDLLWHRTRLARLERRLDLIRQDSWKG